MELYLFFNLNIKLSTKGLLNVSEKDYNRIISDMHKEFQDNDNKIVLFNKNNFLKILIKVKDNYYILNEQNLIKLVDELVESKQDIGNFLFSFVKPCEDWTDEDYNNINNVLDARSYINKNKTIYYDTVYKHNLKNFVNATEKEICEFELCWKNHKRIDVYKKDGKSLPYNRNKPYSGARDYAKIIYSYVDYVIVSYDLTGSDIEVFINTEYGYLRYYKLNNVTFNKKCEMIVMEAKKKIKQKLKPIKSYYQKVGLER